MDLTEVIEKRFQRKLNINNCLLCLRFVCAKDSKLAEKLKKEIVDKIGMVALQCKILNSFSPMKKIRYFVERLFREPLTDIKRKEIVNILCCNDYYSLIFIVNIENLCKYKEFKNLFVFNGEKFKIKKFQTCTNCSTIKQILNLDHLGIEIDDYSLEDSNEFLVKNILYSSNSIIFKERRKEIIDYFKRNTYFNDLIIEELKKNMQSILYLLIIGDKDEKKHSKVMKIDTLLMLYEALIGIDDDWIKLDKTRY